MEISRKEDIRSKLDMVRNAARIGVDIIRLVNSLPEEKKSVSFDEMSSSARADVIGRIMEVYCDFIVGKFVLPKNDNAMISFYVAVYSYFMGQMGTVSKDNSEIGSDKKIGLIVLFLNFYKGDLSALVESLSKSGVDINFRRKDAKGVIHSRIVDKCLSSDECFDKVYLLAEDWFLSSGYWSCNTFV